MPAVPGASRLAAAQGGTNVSRLDGDVSAATAGSLVRTLTYSYDAAGQLTAASDPDSSYAVSYDNLGRVLTVDNNGTSGVPRVILTSGYDAAGNRSSLSASVAGTADLLEHVHPRCPGSAHASGPSGPGRQHGGRKAGGSGL